jgi:hypothetical protein
VWDRDTLSAYTIVRSTGRRAGSAAMVVTAGGAAALVVPVGGATALVVSAGGAAPCAESSC